MVMSDTAHELEHLAREENLEEADALIAQLETDFNLARAGLDDAFSDIQAVIQQQSGGS